METIRLRKNIQEDIQETKKDIAVDCLKGLATGVVSGSAQVMGVIEVAVGISQLVGTRNVVKILKGLGTIGLGVSSIAAAAWIQSEMADNVTDELSSDIDTLERLKVELAEYEAELAKYDGTAEELVKAYIKTTDAEEEPATDSEAAKLYRKWTALKVDNEAGTSWPSDLNDLLNEKYGEHMTE